ncbi:hypothetical protein [Shinella zoogloeoides]|uniref:hypothetical protein n=1 Tax=Shinella zoogloeoides TaxID=352475 RepID=UPI00273DDA9D|nr:hypothetical protein [Shinella zoogloeoides]WLR90928.1 hypothetical protein Q9316_00695 [Shinella zoogloeoides]
MEIKFVGVMILVQLLGGGSEPEISTKVLTILPIEQCEEQVKTLNADLKPPKFTEDGKVIVYERRQCALMMDRELAAAMKRLEQ